MYHHFSWGARPASTPTPSTAASTAAPRSDAVFLVKNLPPDTDVGVLKDMFTRYGPLARFLLPPSKALAVVEYTDSRNAAPSLPLPTRDFNAPPSFLSVHLWDC